MLENQSYQNEEFLLDVPFTADEVTRAVARLKKRKAPGPDGLMAEHLKGGGEAVVIWLMKILNATVELESVLMVHVEEGCCGACLQGERKGSHED